MLLISREEHKIIFLQSSLPHQNWVKCYFVYVRFPPNSSFLCLLRTVYRNSVALWRALIETVNFNGREVGTKGTNQNYSDRFWGNVSFVAEQQQFTFKLAMLAPGCLHSSSLTLTQRDNKRNLD